MGAFSWITGFTHPVLKIQGQLRLRWAENGLDFRLQHRHRNFLGGNLMIYTFFIVDQATYEATDWSPDAWLDVAPRLIGGGPEEGGYAVNDEIFNCDPAFEAYRTLLESMPTAQCNEDDLDEWFPPSPDE